MKPAPTTAPRLSVAIIARNCAAILPPTIASIQSLADEMVVLDTGSTDATCKLAEDAGATVCRRAWDDSFAAARNACLERTTGDWVLWLDAGETLEPTHLQQLRTFLASYADPQHVYSLSVLVPSAAGGLGSEQVARIRLHPRVKGLQFAGRVRERLDQAIATLGLQVDALPFVIHRGSHDQELPEKRAKAQRNIRLADLQMAEEGPSPLLHSTLGEAFQTLGDSVRAAQHYRRALDLAGRSSREQLEAYYGLLTSLDGMHGDRSDQLSLCMLALDHFPLDAQLLVALGGYLQTLGQPALAIRSFDLAFRHGQIEALLWHLPAIREIAASCAAALLVETRDDEQARTLLEAAVRTFPRSQRLALQIVELHVRYGRRDEAIDALGAAFPGPARERLAAAVRGACLAGQGEWTAATDLLQAAMLDGCRERFCLRALVTAWLALRRPQEARAALRAWQEIEPGHAELGELADQVSLQLKQMPEATAETVRLDPGAAPLPGGARRASSAGLGTGRVR